MASQTRSYLVVSPLPVVVEEAGASISYQPGAVFTAKNTNPSVVRLLEEMSIIDVTGQSTTQGFAVIQGEVGPAGPTGPTGPIGPAGGLPSALAIDNRTLGVDIEITNADNIVGQSDGAWDIGSPDSGTTPLRPGTIYVQGSVDVSSTVLSTTQLVASAAFTVLSGADSNLNLTAADATPTSNNDGGDLVLTAGAKDGSGAEGKIEFRGNYTNPLVADIADGVLNFWDAGANKTITVHGDPGAVRVGRNGHLTLAEGDAVFGNDGSVAGTQTGLMAWDASAIELQIFDNALNRMIDLDGASNEIAVYEATGVRGLKVTTNGALAEFRAEDATFRSGTDTVLDLLIRGGNSEGTENGGKVTIEAGRALGSGTDSTIQFRTGNMDRWYFDENGYLLANTDNGYNIGAVGANRPLRVYVGTEVVVGDTITISADTLTASGVLNISADGAVTASAPASSAGIGGTWSWTAQAGEPAVAGVVPVTGFAGGGYIVAAGVGGAAQGTAVGGESGGDAAAGGTIQIVGGLGGAGQDGAVDVGQPGDGGPAWLIGGAGGAGAGVSDNADGGDVLIRAGAAGTGGSGAAGVDGLITIGDLNTSQISIGSGSVTSASLYGSLTTVEAGVTLTLRTGGADRWQMNTAGDLVTTSDDTVDIGAVGANRPQTLYLGTSLVVGSPAGTGTLQAANAIAAATAGTALVIAAGDATAGAVGGSVVIDGGAGDTGGAAFLRGGASSTAQGAMADVVGGASSATGFAGGEARLLGGVPTDGNGGNVSLLGADGVGTDRDGGNVVIEPGAPTGSGTAGLVAIAGSAGRRAQVGGPTSLVAFYGAAPVVQQADISSLSDGSGGTPDNTIASITGTGDDANINNNFADLTSKVNALRALLQAYGLMA